MNQSEHKSWLPDSILTVREAAEWLRISTRKLFTLRKCGEIVARDIGGVRFLFRDLMEFVNRRAIPVEAKNGKAER